MLSSVSVRELAPDAGPNAICHGPLPARGRHRYALASLDGLTCARVLEVGCGDGRCLATLSSRALVAVGVDPDPEMLRSTTMGRPVAALGERLPFRTSSFDVAILLDVLEHADDEDAVLAKARWRRRGFGWLSVVMAVYNDRETIEEINGRVQPSGSGRGSICLTGSYQALAADVVHGSGS